VTRVTGAYFISFWWFRCLFVQLLPCVSLVILNILLFSAMRRAEQRRRRLTINKTKPVKKARVARKNTMARRMSIFGFTKESRDRRQRDANSTTMMLIVVIAVFLAVEIPLSVISALHTISSSLVEFLDYQLVNNIILFINVIICLSYPLNFAIYCGMSRQFRKTFRSVFLSPALHILRSCGPTEEVLEEATEGLTQNKSRMDVSATSTRMSKLTTSMDNKPLLGVDHLDNKLGVDHLEAMSKNREVSVAIKEEKEEEENGNLGKSEQKEKEKGNNLTEGDTGKKKEEGEEEMRKEEIDVNETNDHASSDTSGLLTTHL